MGECNMEALSGEYMYSNICSFNRAASWGFQLPLNTYIPTITARLKCESQLQQVGVREPKGLRHSQRSPPLSKQLNNQDG